MNDNILNIIFNNFHIPILQSAIKVRRRQLLRHVFRMISKQTLTRTTMKSLKKEIHRIETFNIGY
jgi:hypothetical protein